MKILYLILGFVLVFGCAAETGESPDAIEQAAKICSYEDAAHPPGGPSVNRTCCHMQDTCFVSNASWDCNDDYGGPGSNVCWRWDADRQRYREVHTYGDDGFDRYAGCACLELGPASAYNGDAGSINKCYIVPGHPSKGSQDFAFAGSDPLRLRGRAWCGRPSQGFRAHLHKNWENSNCQALWYVLDSAECDGFPGYFRPL